MTVPCSLGATRASTTPNEPRKRARLADDRHPTRSRHDDVT
jgi:hypothetical protein